MRVIAALRQPGQLATVVVSAPTISSGDIKCPDEEKAADSIDDTLIGKARVLKAIDGQYRKGRFNRWLDVLVSWSGSPISFLLISAGLIAWAALGIAGWGNDATWNVLISDIQAIACYVIDTLLVRQQLAAHDELLITIGVLQSRTASVERMLSQLQHPPTLSDTKHEAVRVDIDIALPRSGRFNRIMRVLASVAGHLFTVSLFCIGIVVWLGFGPSMDWSSDWQLYMNSSSSALLLFVFAFLACVRECHASRVKACTEHIAKTDVEVERALRELTGDHLANPVVVISAPPVGRLQRMINWYAEVVGSLSGLVLLVAVLVVWVVFGPLLQFSSTWFLLIGTYAGLVGMQDGFVIRNMDHQLHHREQTLLARLSVADNHCQTLIRQTVAPAIAPAAVSEGRARKIWRRINDYTTKASLRISYLVSHRYTVVGGLILLVALLVAATAMGWSLAGQLVANVPPSLVESFVMLVLITGHNLNDKATRSDFSQLLERRAVLLAYARHLRDHGQDVPFQPIIVGGQHDSPLPEKAAMGV